MIDQLEVLGPHPLGGEAAPAANQSTDPVPRDPCDVLAQWEPRFLLGGKLVEVYPVHLTSSSQKRHSVGAIIQPCFVLEVGLSLVIIGHKAAIFNPLAGGTLNSIPGLLRWAGSLVG